MHSTPTQKEKQRQRNIVHGRMQFFIFQRLLCVPFILIYASQVGSFFSSAGCSLSRPPERIMGLHSKGLYLSHSNLIATLSVKYIPLVAFRVAHLLAFHPL